MKGVLFIHCETGTEGGIYAFQDAAYIGTRIEHRCKKCGAWWAWGGVGDFEPDGDKRVGDYVLRSCKKGEHDVGDVEVPSWGYAGTHLLETGDHLTVYDKTDPNVLVWSGQVKLKPRRSLDQFMHAEPRNVDIDEWRKWFTNEWPAELVKGDNAERPHRRPRTTRASELRTLEKDK